MIKQTLSAVLLGFALVFSAPAQAWEILDVTSTRVTGNGKTMSSDAFVLFTVNRGSITDAPKRGTMQKLGDGLNLRLGEHSRTIIPTPVLQWMKRNTSRLGLTSAVNDKEFIRTNQAIFIGRIPSKLSEADFEYRDLFYAQRKMIRHRSWVNWYNCEQGTLANFREFFAHGSSNSKWEAGVGYEQIELWQQKNPAGFFNAPSRTWGEHLAMKALCSSPIVHQSYFANDRQGTETAVAKGRARWLSRFRYPMRSLRNEEQGTVEFKVQVTPNGRSTLCRITRSSGYASLDQSACRSMVRYSRFARNERALDTPLLPYRDRAVYRIN
ncbi:MAG: energy transducer TonB [Pseudomonadota bacterium]